MFDRIVVVDWSANSRPKTGPDSIWIAHRDRGEVPAPPTNPRTRHEALQCLEELLAAPGRVLVGFDFAFGYPAGFAAATELEGAAWEATWAYLAANVVDDDRNRNNRFEVAARLNERLGGLHFWGSPKSRAGAWLTTTKPRTDLLVDTHRATERSLLAEGKRPFPAWQLLGAGAVGSQTLTGIAALERLRRRPSIAHRVQVWPFDTGLRLPEGDDAIVFAEVWPSALSFADIEGVSNPVKDARQVIALAEALAADDGSMFCPAVPDEHAVLTEEGWVLRPG